MTPSTKAGASRGGGAGVLRVRRSGPLRGTCRMPGDKSISHRALLFAALADGPVEIEGLGSGEDNVSTARALRALGISVVMDAGEARARVEGGQGFDALQAAAGPIDCGNSGTTIRLLAGLLAGRPFETVLEGDASLTRRPMTRLADPLRRMGASLDGRVDPARPLDLFPPLRLAGGDLRGLRAALPVASAQIKSAVCLAGLQARGRTMITEPGLSRDHTERMLRFLGAPIAAEPDRGLVTIDPDGWSGRLRAAPVRVPGDLSSAAFILVAALVVPGSDVTVEGVGLNPTRAGVLDALRAMGGTLDVTVTGDVAGEPVGRLRARAGGQPLRGVRIDGTLALRAIDEIPALAVAAAAAEGPTTFADLGELRIKESDRIAALCRELGRAGAAVNELPSGMVVMGRQAASAALRGGSVTPDHDHRIAMAGAVMGLIAEAGEETLLPAADIATSFPAFAETLRSLGATID